MIIIKVRKLEVSPYPHVRILLHRSASPATVPSSLDCTVAARLRYRLDGTVASAFSVGGDISNSQVNSMVTITCIMSHGLLLSGC